MTVLSDVGRLGFVLVDELKDALVIGIDCALVKLTAFRRLGDAAGCAFEVGYIMSNLELLDALGVELPEDLQMEVSRIEALFSA